MARYGWWQHRGLRPPAQIREEFQSAGVRMNVNTTTPTKPAVYYRISGRLLSLLPRMSVVDDLYVLRTMSTIVSLLTLVVAWLAARACLGVAGGATVMLLLALHPQFAIMSTAVSADAMVTLLGACVWWQAAVAVRQGHLRWPLTAMWLAALCAALADRSAFPLLVIASAVSIFVVSLRLRFRGWKAAVVVAVVATLAGISIWFVRTLQTTFVVLSEDWFLTPAEAINAEFLWRFSSFLFQSWWSSLGWVRYAPPSWWTAVAFVVVAIAAVGVGRRLSREADTRTRMLLGLALMSFAVQLFAVYWAYFRLGHGAQGKSLFPVLVPSLILLWAGLEAWVPPSRRTHAAIAIVVLFALLDAAVWALVAIPAYASS